MSDLKKIFSEMQKDFALLDDNWKEWNNNYFFQHKLKYIKDLELVRRFHKCGKILEIGSMPFHFTILLKKSGYPVLGLDLDPSRAQKFIDKNELDVVACDIENEKLPFKDNSFNLIVFSEVFEHLRINPIKTLREISRILSKDGILIITLPNLYSIFKIISFNLGRGFNNAYKEFKKLETLGHMGHVREYSTREMKLFLKNTGFEILNIKYEYYKKTKGILFFLNFFHFFIPKWRPIQVLICKKQNTSAKK